MDGYTVRQLGRLAGVSVRTLHHYDQIGLLKAPARTKAGYRVYGPAELLRLQQILFLKELDVPLSEVARILGQPEFDPVQALRGHRRLLEERIGRLYRLLDTLDRTVAQYEGGCMLKDEELYEGFSREDAARMRREAREQWGVEAVEASERKVRRMSKDEWAAVRKEGEALNADLARLMDKDPGDPAVQAVVARHRAWIEHFWTPTAETYRALGRSYVDHPEFRAFYERVSPGLAEFLAEAIARYGDGAGGAGRRST
jgi:DNA-binding transcriptional MerR regulator